MFDRVGLKPDDVKGYDSLKKSQFGIRKS